MAKLTSFGQPPEQMPCYPGLLELVRFPGKSTVWIFDATHHTFHPEILGGNIGCGMAAFMTPKIDYKEVADILFAHLKKKSAPSRGIHFIDICGPIEFLAPSTNKPYHFLLVHMHGLHAGTPSSIRDAVMMQESAQRQRRDIGYELADVLGVETNMMGDWPHNTVEEDGQHIIYRKKAIKVEPKEPSKLYLLPAHLGAKILAYSVTDKHAPPHNSMPHATGRSGIAQATIEQAVNVRNLAYIPRDIPSESLRSEHPSCYNDFEKIFAALLGKERHFVPIGEARILSYVKAGHIH